MRVGVEPICLRIGAAALEFGDASARWPHYGVLLNPFEVPMRLSGVVGNRSLASDEVWAVIGPLFPAWKGNGRPVADRRLVVEGTAWKFRTGAPWRDLPERFGNWNTVFKNFDRWAKDGTWTKVLEHVQTRAEAPGDLDWIASIDSTIVRVHQHGATLSPAHRGSLELHETRP